MSLQLKLERVIGNSYIITNGPRSPTPGLVINNDNQTAILIDTGPSESFAKAIDKTILNAGYRVAAIISTHHHPDHHGGNAFFQRKYPEIKIFATSSSPR